MTARCEKTDLFVEQCSHCRGLDDVDPLDTLRVERFLTARFDGRCVVSTEHPIAAGDLIGLAEGGGYACESCTNGARG